MSKTNKSNKSQITKKKGGEDEYQETTDTDIVEISNDELENQWSDREFRNSQKSLLYVYILAKACSVAQCELKKEMVEEIIGTNNFDEIMRYILYDTKNKYNSWINEYERFIPKGYRYVRYVGFNENIANFLENKLNEWNRKKFFGNNETSSTLIEEVYKKAQKYIKNYNNIYEDNQERSIREETFNNILVALEKMLSESSSYSGGNNSVPVEYIKYNNRKYRVHLGIRGGKFILVGKDKKKIYI